LENLDLSYVVTLLFLLGIVVGWSWKVARWLIDIKSGVNDVASILNGLKSEVATLRQSDSDLWQQVAWLRGRIGEPLDKRD